MCVRVAYSERLSDGESLQSEVAMQSFNEHNLNTLEPDSDIILHVCQSRNRLEKPKNRLRRASVETFLLAFCLGACGSDAPSTQDAPISIGSTGRPPPPPA